MIRLGVTSRGTPVEIARAVVEARVEQVALLGTRYTMEEDFYRARLERHGLEVLIPDEPDHLAVYLAAFSYLDESAETGVKFYRYQDGFLHEKAMLIDDEVASLLLEVERQALENRRVEREKLRLQADVVEPANAQRAAAKVKAEGDAAPILERGRASAEAMAQEGAKVTICARDEAALNKTRDEMAATGAEVMWLNGHHDIHAQQPQVVAAALLEPVRDLLRGRDAVAVIVRVLVVERAVRVQVVGPGDAW